MGGRFTRDPPSVAQRDRMESDAALRRRETDAPVASELERNDPATELRDDRVADLLLGTATASPQRLDLQRQHRRRAQDGLEDLLGMLTLLVTHGCLLTCPKDPLRT